MIVKDLLRIIFRIFGIYSVLNVIFNFLPSQISYLLNPELLFPNYTENGKLQLWTYFVMILIFTILVFYTLIINPDIIIKHIKPKHFLEKTINLEKLNAESLVQIATVSLGVLLLFNSVPEFLNKALFWYKIKEMNNDFSANISELNFKSELFLSLLKIVIGLVFIIFQNSIGRFIYRKNN